MTDDEYQDFDNDSDAEDANNRIDELESKVEELESKVDDLETGGRTSRGQTGGAATYGLGGCLAMILSWHSFHAVLWALLAGVFSWLYVIYYVVLNWSNVKLI